MNARHELCRNRVDLFLLGMIKNRGRNFAGRKSFKPVSYNTSNYVQCACTKNETSLRSFHRFAVRGSSAHEGKIIIFERFQCSLSKTIQLNRQLVKLIGKIEICSISANFCKTRPRLPSENEQKTPILEIFRTISPKHARWPHNFFLPIWVMITQLHVQKNTENSEC